MKQASPAGPVRIARKYSVDSKIYRSREKMIFHWGEVKEPVHLARRVCREPAGHSTVLIYAEYGWDKTIRIDKSS